MLNPSHFCIWYNYERNQQGNILCVCCESVDQQNNVITQWCCIFSKSKCWQTDFSHADEFNPPFKHVSWESISSLASIQYNTKHSAFEVEPCSASVCSTALFDGLFYGSIATTDKQPAWEVAIQNGAAHVLQSSWSECCLKPPSKAAHKQVN